MKKFYVKFIVGIFFVNFITNVNAESAYTPYKIQDINELEPIKLGFVKSFLDGYKLYTLEQLGITSKEKFLEDAFQDEIDDFGKSSFEPIALKDADGNLVGYFSIDNLDLLKTTDAEKYKDFPDNSIYIRQLFVNIPYQRKSVGSFMINGCIDEFFPHAKHIYVATRKINQRAIHFFKKNGYSQISKNLHDLPIEKYISFEKHING